jgi:6-phosphofructokinase
MIKKPKTVAILCAGGPAPGVNTVVATITKRFLVDGYRVIGLHHGFKTIFTPKPYFLQLTYAIADRIYERKGSMLVMDRHKPADKDFNADFFKRENIVLLVTIGGDDTASTANRLSEYLLKNNLPVQNIHVPKTIDNDIPLPGQICTFGFQTAKDKGSDLAKTYMEEARTNDMWMIASCMGREAGHLALGIGSACHYPIIIMAEMFNKTPVTFDKVSRLIISSMVKRKIMKPAIHFGAAIISEGIFHQIDGKEIAQTGIRFSYDKHNHPELGLISKAHLINDQLERALYVQNSITGLEIKTRAAEIGYEIRCVDPNGFDLYYCTSLGMAVKKLFDEGHTQCIALVTAEGEFKALKMSDIADTNGKIIPRLVDMDSHETKSAMRRLEVLGPNDMVKARKYLANPKNFSFNTILNW